MSMKKTVVTAGGAACVACLVAFTPVWEGMDLVAHRDAIGTGHPITYCDGQTDEFGTVEVGQRFTREQCNQLLAQSLPKYLAPVAACVHVPVAAKTIASLVDAAYNAGPAAVCRSPMVAHINAGNIRDGCNAFAGWYVRSDGKVRTGLVARRSGIGDGRKSEKQLCLEGLAQPKSEWRTDWIVTAEASPSPPAAAPAPPPAKPAVHHRKRIVRAKPPVECSWWRKCS